MDKNNVSPELTRNPCTEAALGWGHSQYPHDVIFNSKFYLIPCPSPWVGGILSCPLAFASCAKDVQSVAVTFAWSSRSHVV